MFAKIGGVSDDVSGGVFSGIFVSSAYSFRKLISNPSKFTL